jgi:mercuric ion transport protein
VIDVTLGTLQPAAMDILPRVRWARTAYRVLAWTFLAGIAIQVFFAGLGIFVGPTWWTQHKSFVHLLEALPVLMLILAFIGRLPTSTKWLTAAAFALIGVQYATIELRLPTLAAFHPVNAILLFWLVLTLAQRMTRLASDTESS